MNKKKKIVLSIVLAAVLVMAMSVTAFAAAPSVSVSNPSPNVGDTVTFTVSCPSDVAGIQGDIATSGLQYVSRTTTPAGMGGENTLVTLGNSASYTYKVTAAAGETVSFSLSGVVTSDASGNETNETGTYAASATVATPAQPTSEPTSQPTSQPTSNPGSNPSASASASAKAGGLDDVPKTGDTTTDIMLFAVIGLAAAATVAIVAGKKALSHK